MAWRCRVVVLAAAALAGCRVHFDRVRYGGTWSPEAAMSLVADVADRGDVLAVLGPPDEVRYTLAEEVFLYRRAGHRGTDLRFLIPDPLINVLRPGVEQIAPPIALPEEAGGTAPPIRASRTLIDVLFGLLNPLSTEEALALYGRRLRWDVARVVLDRSTRRALSVEVFLGIPAREAARVLRAGGPSETTRETWTGPQTVPFPDTGGEDMKGGTQATN